MPFPIPPKPWSADFEYFLVALPADQGFVRAVKGHFGELGFSSNWGEEGPEVDSEEAAQRMLEAIDETWRLIEMGFPDLILGYIDEIEELLRALQTLGGGCCESDATGGVLSTDDVADGVGDVPANVVSAGYASGPADWAGFADYKCMIAHVVVDDMEAKLRKIAPILDAAGAVAGGIAALVGIVSVLWSGGLTALAGGILASLAGVAKLYDSLVDDISTLGLADDVATAHDDLALAFYCDTDGPSAAIAALESRIDGLFGPIDALILKNLNWQPAARALYAGRYDATNIAQKLADAGYATGSYTCDCAQLYDFDVTFSFDADLEDWRVVRQASWNGMPDYYFSGPGGCQILGGTNKGEMVLDAIWLRQLLGLTYPFTVEIAVFDAQGKIDIAQGGSNGGTLQIVYDSDQGSITDSIQEPGDAINTWLPLSLPVQGETKLLQLDQDTFLRVWAIRTTGTSWDCAIDEIRIAGWIT